MVGLVAACADRPLPLPDAQVDLSASSALDLAVIDLAGQNLTPPMLRFAAPLWYPLGGNPVPQAVIAADFDGDGHVDLATGNFDQSVSVLLGHGDGTFAAALVTSLGQAPMQLAPGDLDGDGRLDLVLPNFQFVDGDEELVSVLLGKGDGTFGAPTSFGIGAPAQSDGADVALLDLDGDHRLDLVVTQFHDARVDVRLGNGDGTFGSPMPFASGIYPLELIAGRFDADDREDLLVINFRDDNWNGTATFLGNQGGGKLGPPVASLDGVAEGWAVVGDLDGDGRLDVVTGTDPVGTVVLGHGDGTFGPPGPEYSFDSNIALGDVDGDGRLDLISAPTAGGLHVLPGVGDGTFRPALTVDAQVKAVSLALGDFDGDGQVDVAVVDYNQERIGIYLNITR